MTYAEGTGVSVEKSKAEIETIVTKYGADQFLTGWENADGEESSAFVSFRCNGKHVRFRLTLPKRGGVQFRRTPRQHYIRTPDAAYKAWEQACRAKWRALLLVIKAKLEAVAAGITIFEDEFLAHIVLPGGQTAGDWMRPQIALAYETGNMPKRLVGLPGPKENAATAAEE